MTHLLQSLTLAELIGAFGFMLYVAAYSLLTLRFLSTACITYFVLNLSAASCVLIGLTASFNLASVLIQLFWVAISLVGIALRLAQPAQDPA